MPGAKKAKRAAACAASALHEDLGRRLDQLDSSTSFRQQELARQAVCEMLALGARFEIVPRQGRPPNWLWEVRGVGNPGRCREIVETAREHGGEYWRAFQDEIIAYARAMGAPE